MENGLKYVGDLLDSLKGDFLSQTDNESTGFNIFKALGIEAKEVLTCRFLGAILEPNGAHELGTEPLHLFLKTVLKIDGTAAYTTGEYAYWMAAGVLDGDDKQCEHGNRVAYCCIADADKDMEKAGCRRMTAYKHG